jgi:hypothetical protein
MLVVAVRSANGTIAFANALRYVLIDSSPFSARVAPSLTLMISGALPASVDVESEMNFKSYFLLPEFQSTNAD